MNRNQNSHFAKNPQVDISRSKFDRSSSVKISFNVGDIVPFYVDEVLPGDTFQVDTAKLVRMQTLVTPVMDDIYLDTYYFFVPNRLVWSHWKNFMGENSESPWIPETTYQVPQMTINLVNDIDFEYEGSVLDYMGIPKPLSDGTLSFNALPFRAYALIYNEWFRDQNLINPVNIPMDETTQTFTQFMTSLKQVDENMDGCLRASKFRDYFTTCLPSPQKGPDVLVPLGSWAPVKTRDQNIYSYTGPDVPMYGFPNLTWYSDDARLTNNSFYPLGIANTSGDLTKEGYTELAATSSVSAADTAITPNNLWADLEGATAATINQLRLAFQIQKIYERDARGGTRYIEILANHFGVTSPDSRLQRPEYLGGNRMLINVNQVVQNSETQETPQGTTTAYSLTTDVHSDFTHSFVEHGFVIGVCVARYNHTYQQGLERFWSRLNRFDYYFPILANIGEQPVYNREIMASGVPGSGTSNDDGVFGYNEAWADYRYKPNRVAGEMRSNAKTPLDMWHLADDYSALPSLSPTWINEDKNNVNRALAVTSDVSNQLFGDFYIKNICTRPMPVYSIPGLIDHH